MCRRSCRRVDLIVRGKSTAETPTPIPPFTIVIVIIIIIAVVIVIIIMSRDTAEQVFARSSPEARELVAARLDNARRKFFT